MSYVFANLLLPVVFIVFIRFIRILSQNSLGQIIQKRSIRLNVKSLINQPVSILLRDIISIKVNLKTDLPVIMILCLLHFGLFILSTNNADNYFGMDGSLLLIYLVISLLQLIYYSKYGSYVISQRYMARTFICLMFICVSSVLLRFSIGLQNVNETSMLSDYLIIIYKLIVFITGFSLIHLAKIEWPFKEVKAVHRWVSEFSQVLWMSVVFVISFGLESVSLVAFSWFSLLVSLAFICADLMGTNLVKKDTHQWLVFCKSVTIPVSIVCVFGIWLGKFYV